jgi:hypothetical protein
MTADSTYGEFYDFYSGSREHFGYTLVYIQRTTVERPSNHVSGGNEKKRSPCILSYTSVYQQYNK